MIFKDYSIRCYYKDGKWSAPEVSDSEMLNIHMASTCLHYGQEAFEGMKAFPGVKMEKSVSSVVKKMQNVCLVLPGWAMMQAPSIELFEEAVVKKPSS